MPILLSGGGSGGGGGGGIPQGGPLTEDLNFNGFAAENVGTMTAAYIVGVSGGNTSLDGGLATTDGEGNWTATSFTGEVSASTVSGWELGTVLAGVNGGPSGTSGTVLYTDGDATNCTVSGNSLSGLYDSTGELNVDIIAANGLTLFGVTVEFISAVSSQTLLATDGDATNCIVSGSPLSSLYDSTGGLFLDSVDIYGQITFLAGSGNSINDVYGTSGVVLTSDGSASGITAFQSDGSIAQATIANVQSLLNDTGWTANADAGDKTVVIGSTASLTTIATALNLVSAGAGTALLNIAQKVKAIETALASGKFPNA